MDEPSLVARELEPSKMSRGDEAPASLAQACWVWVLAASETMARLQLPTWQHVGGHLETGTAPPKGPRGAGRQAQVGTWWPSWRGRPTPGASSGLAAAAQRAGGRAEGPGEAGNARPRPAPASRPPSRRCAGNRDPRVLGGWLRGRGRQAGGDGEGPRAEGAGRNMGGPRAWALLCFGLLLPGGSAAWSVGGAPFSARR